MVKILVVEDDRRIRAEVMEALIQEQFDVSVAADVSGARRMLEDSYDLVLLDLGLPDGDGMTICHELRSEGRDVPVLILSARDAPANRVLGLENGADDYLIKPFHMPELSARIKNLLRRSGRQVDDGLARCGQIEIHAGARRAQVRGSALKLRRREFDLLQFFVRNPGRVWSREQLLLRVWGASFEGDIRTVDIHIRRLRLKIEETPEQPRILTTEFGVGYRMECVA